MNYRELNGKTIRAGFLEFHSKNPKVYAEFEKQCLTAINIGRKKLSAKLIVNFIRWKKFIDTTDQNFRINDAYHSYYARLFVEKHPEYKDIFEFRKLRNEQNAPYMQVDQNGQLTFL